VPRKLTSDAVYDSPIVEDNQVSFLRAMCVDTFRCIDASLHLIDYLSHLLDIIHGMSKAKLRSNGLGIVSEGLELSEDQLPPFGNDKIKVYPMAWKNPLTGKLAMTVYQTLSERFILKMAAFSIILPKFATGCINYNDVRFIPSMFILMTGKRATPFFLITRE
jgi:hypothetical protein